MEVKKLVLPLLFLSTMLGAQNTFEKAKKLRATATIAPGFLFEGGPVNIYLHGLLEYFPEEKVSLRGDSYFTLKSSDDTRVLNKNHSVMFGIMYHLNKNKKLAPFVGLQTGINFTELNKPLISLHESVISPMLVIVPKTTVVPIVVLRVGETIFIGNHFNIFYEFTYIKGKLNKNTYTPLNLDELRISFGLGFDI